MTNKLAVVSGAGSGIGKAIALGFAAQGDRVHGMRSPSTVCAPARLTRRFSPLSPRS
jgi:NAD(P)-dependent dehydrogenase (short-subunit alcohol dehydrogenase family)